MRQFWSRTKLINFYRQYCVACWYYQARLSPELRYGVTKLGSDAIFGYRYALPVEVNLIRSSVSYKIIHTETGKIYEGGARFSIPPIFSPLAGLIEPLSMYETVYKGDVIVLQSWAIRDYDVLTRGKRDALFAFDVKRVLSVGSVDINGKEVLYKYGKDYLLQIDGVPAQASVADDDTVEVKTQNAMAIVSDLRFVWLEGGNAPAEWKDYNVEFTCSPNFVVYDDMASQCGTDTNDLPRSVMTVKRAFFAKQDNPIDQIDTEQMIYESHQHNMDEDFNS